MISENVMIDPFVSNELGDPEELLDQEKRKNNLTGLNLTYDTTPPEFISAVVTEFGEIPSNSVQVILREFGGLF